MEKEGFNRQKHSGLNLEPVYRSDPEQWNVYYVWLQRAFRFVPLLERGSLLRRWAAERGRPFWKRFGSLRNMARRLLDTRRFHGWEARWFEAAEAGTRRLGLDSSSALASRPLRRVP